MTTWADHYRDILSHPADDGPRLVAADWLAEFGTTQEQHERAEFIRVQCELAQCPVSVRSDRRWNDSRYMMPQPWDRLRRRESELLSAVSPETCPRCKGHYVFGNKWECTSCKKGKVQISNAVRWAGKLGDVEPFPWAEQPVWHVGWGWGRGEQRIDARFVRGFIGAISLSCAALVGERCEICNGTGMHRYYPDLNGEPNYSDSATCGECDGSGRVDGLRSELRQHPLGECVLSDKRPRCSMTHPHWSLDTGPQHPCTQHPCTLPPELFECLDRTNATEVHEDQVDYPSAAAASAAASAACCRWIREGELDYATVRTA